MTAKEKPLAVFKESLTTIIWGLSFYGSKHPVMTASGFLIAIFSGLSSVVTAFVLSRFLDALLHAANTGETAPIKEAIALFVGSYLFLLLLNLIHETIRKYMSVLTDLEGLQLIFSKTFELGVQELEKPEVNNQMQRAKDSVTVLFNLHESCIQLTVSTIGLISNALIIFVFSPIMMLALFVGNLPFFVIDRVFIARFWSFEVNNTERRRDAFQTAGYLSETEALQELLMTGASRSLLERFKSFAQFWIKEKTSITTRWQIARFFPHLLTHGVIAWCAFTVTDDFLAGAITLGTVSFRINSLFNLNNQVKAFFFNLSAIYEVCVRVREIRRYVNLGSVVHSGSKDVTPSGRAPEICLRNVSFQYPGSDKKVLDNINLTIAAGEKVAVVGPNGAGKTTLIRIIARFYQPDSGTIFINNTPLSDIRQEDWNKHLGVLFQNSVCYPNLTARENIFLGDVSRCNEDERIKAAAESADATFIEGYEKGYDTRLSEKYQGGTRPSGGQWQKILIAKFFFRNSPLVIMDEPTAFVDADAEERIFSRIYSFLEGRTVLVISHRFSTVRKADRIIVLSEGRIIEEGTHDDLIRLNGAYAKGFKIQAKGYQMENK